MLDPEFESLADDKGLTLPGIASYSSSSPKVSESLPSRSFPINLA